MLEKQTVDWRAALTLALVAADSWLTAGLAFPFTLPVLALGCGDDATGEEIRSLDVARAASVDSALACKFDIAFCKMLLFWFTIDALDAVTVANVLFVFVCTPYQ